MEFVILVWDLLGVCHPFLVSYFSLLQWEYLSYACPMTVLWKHIMFLVSQVQSCRGSICNAHTPQKWVLCQLAVRNPGPKLHLTAYFPRPSPGTSKSALLRSRHHGRIKCVRKSLGKCLLEVMERQQDPADSGTGMAPVNGERESVALKVSYPG